MPRYWIIKLYQDKINLFKPKHAYNNTNTNRLSLSIIYQLNINNRYPSKHLTSTVFLGYIITHKH